MDIAQVVSAATVIPDGGLAVNHPGVGAVCMVVRVVTPGGHPTARGWHRSFYRGGVVWSVRPAALRWVLLCALALGLIGMHNLAAGDPAHGSMGQIVMPSTPTAAMAANSTDAVGMSCCGADHDLVMGLPGHHSGYGHDMLHLCLAVLVAAAVLTLAWLLWRRGRTAWRHRKPTTSLPEAGRGPPLALRTSGLLSCLCVLRL